MGWFVKQNRDVCDNEQQDGTDW